MLIMYITITYWSWKLIQNNEDINFFYLFRLSTHITKKISFSSSVLSQHKVFWTFSLVPSTYISKSSLNTWSLSSRPSFFWPGKVFIEDPQYHWLSVLNMKTFKRVKMSAKLKKSLSMHFLSRSFLVTWPILSKPFNKRTLEATMLSTG